MKYITTLLLLLTVPVLAQDISTMTLSQVESTLEARCATIATAPETDVLIQADAQALIRYRQVLAENPEIQAIDKARMKAEEALSALVQQEEAKEKELQKTDPSIKAAKDASDKARSASEAVYQTPEIQSLEARRTQLITDAKLAEQAKK